MNFEQIKQAAFVDEMEKIAISEGLWARSANSVGNRKYIVQPPDTRDLVSKRLSEAALESKGKHPLSPGPIRQLQHPWSSENMLKSTKRIDPKLGLRDTKVLKNIFKLMNK